MGFYLQEVEIPIMPSSQKIFNAIGGVPRAFQYSNNSGVSHSSHPRLNPFTNQSVSCKGL
jgi:hypothetical protein